MSSFHYKFYKGQSFCVSYGSFIVVFLLLGSLSSHAYSRNCGVMGETFPVLELSFLSFIEKRLNSLSESGELDAMNKQWINLVTQHANRPTPLNLPRASENHTHTYEPSIVLSRDILGAKGEVLIGQGTTVNALKKLQSYEPHWLLFDGDDKAQVRWAEHALKNFIGAKVILTGGAVGLIEQELQCAIFFDQGARISHQLGIKQVPVHVSRRGDVLLIEEIAIKEDGYAR